MRDERDRLNELFEELENIRVGRRVRRRAAAVAAAVFLAGAAVTVTFVNAPTPAPTAPQIAQDPSTPASVELSPAPEPTRYAWLERIETEPAALTHVESNEPTGRVEVVRSSGTLSSVTIVDDRELARALRAASPGTGVARVNGRVILTGTLAEREESDETPSIGL